MKIANRTKCFLAMKKEFHGMLTWSPEALGKASVSLQKGVK